MQVNKNLAAIAEQSQAACNRLDRVLQNHSAARDGAPGAQDTYEKACGNPGYRYPVNNGYGGYGAYRSGGPGSSLSSSLEVFTTADSLFFTTSSAS